MKNTNIPLDAISLNINANIGRTSELIGRIFGVTLCAAFSQLLFHVITHTHNITEIQSIVLIYFFLIVFFLCLQSFYYFFKISFHLKPKIKDQESYILFNTSIISIYQKIYNRAVIISALLCFGILSNLVYFNFSKRYLSSSFINQSGIVIACVILYNLYRIRALKSPDEILIK